jgi:hypothetical protein
MSDQSSDTNARSNARYKWQMKCQIYCQRIKCFISRIMVSYGFQHRVRVLNVVLRRAWPLAMAGIDAKSVRPIVPGIVPIRWPIHAWWSCGVVQCAFHVGGFVDRMLIVSFNRLASSSTTLNSCGSALLLLWQPSSQLIRLACS